MVMSHANKFYSHGHLTRKARQHLARLYLEAEKDNTLTAKIQRHQNRKQPKTHRPPPPAIPGAIPNVEKTDSPPKSHEMQPVTARPDMQQINVEFKKVSHPNPSPVPEKDFETLLIEDIRKQQWGPRIRQSPKSDRITPRSRKDLNWGSIIEYEQHQFEKLTKKLHQEREEAKERYRDSLFQQMKKHQEMEHRALLAEEHEAEEIRKQQRLLNQQTKELQAEYHRKMEELKNSRIQQIQEREEQRRHERNETKEMQKRAAETIRRKLEADRAYAIAKKEENRRHQWELILENNREREAKRLLAAKEVEETKRLQKMYKDLLDKQEQERLKELELRHEKQRQHDAGYESIRKHREEIARHEEERIAHDQQLIAEMQVYRDKIEAEMRQKALDENQEKLLQQIQEKIRRKAEAKQLELAYKEKLIEAAKHDRERAEHAAAQASKEKRRLQEELQQQIKEYESKLLLQKVEMTDIERSLNKSILNKIADEQHLE